MRRPSFWGQGSEQTRPPHDLGQNKGRRKYWRKEERGTTDCATTAIGYPEASLCTIHPAPRSSASRPGLVVNGLAGERVNGLESNRGVRPARRPLSSRLVPKALAQGDDWTICACPHYPRPGLLARGHLKSRCGRAAGCCSSLTFPLPLDAPPLLAWQIGWSIGRLTDSLVD